MSVDKIIRQFSLLSIVYCLTVLYLSLTGCAGLRIKNETKINPHREQKYCLECHTKEGSSKLKSRTIKLCSRCHQEIIKGGSHPMNIVYSKPVAGLLYFEKKKIVCVTCHEAHGKTEYQKLLRMASDDLCLTCHQK